MSTEQTDEDVRVRRSISDALRRARKERGGTQADFSAATGWGRQHIYRIETSGTGSLDSIIRWCDACGTDPAELVADAIRAARSATS